MEGRASLLRSSPSFVFNGEEDKGDQANRGLADIFYCRVGGGKVVSLSSNYNYIYETKGFVSYDPRPWAK